MDRQVDFGSNISGEENAGGSILTTKLINRTGRSRLRAAGAYSETGYYDDWSHFVDSSCDDPISRARLVTSVNENDSGAFSVEAYLELDYWPYEEASYDGDAESIILWEGARAGIHQGDPAIVLQAVTDLVDQFIAEFLDDEDEE